jgi:hypothetical protein
MMTAAAITDFLMVLSFSVAENGRSMLRPLPGWVTKCNRMQRWLPAG